MNIEWTDERVGQLRSLWTEGLSATAIGKVMNITRNAVLGKRFRLKLDGRNARNDTFYRPRVRSNRIRKYPSNCKTVFPNRERKPNFTIPRQKFTPRMVVVTSPITGAILTAKRRAPTQPEMTKPQLRAMLTQAVLNTGGTL